MSGGSHQSHGGKTVSIRPPKWETSKLNKSDLPIRTKEILTLQAEYLDLFRRSCASHKWKEIHKQHFDWWQFPIDDGSRPEFNLKSESDIELLKADPLWLSGYHESVQLVALAWGWDVDKRALTSSGGSWDRKDVRLAKIIRSLWLFQEVDYFESMQLFAMLINETEYNKRGFFYGSICLDEILYMNLPRR